MLASVGVMAPALLEVGVGVDLMAFVCPLGVFPFSFSSTVSLRLWCLTEEVFEAFKFSGKEAAAANKSNVQNKIFQDAIMKYNVEKLTI